MEEPGKSLRQLNVIYRVIAKVKWQPSNLQTNVLISIYTSNHELSLRNNFVYLP